MRNLIVIYVRGADHGLDFEEYYSVNVLQRGKNSDQIYYGANYGVYASRFYNPGKVLSGTATNPANLGVQCSFPSGQTDISKCEIVYTLSADLNTGQNPYTGDPADANAFCDNTLGKCTEPINEVNELYLIDLNGKKKTILGRKKIDNDGADGDYALGKLVMDGLDLDQNGFVDVFNCRSEYNCFGKTASEKNTLFGDVFNIGALRPPFKSADDFSTNYDVRMPRQSDWEEPFDPDSSYFVPISPFAVDVTDLRFIINPVEDPYKAYAEDEIKTHPSVTIIMKMGLAEETKADYPGTFSEITLQTTVAAGVLGSLDTYPATDNLDWIKALEGKVPSVGP